MSALRAAMAALALLTAPARDEVELRTADAARLAEVRANATGRLRLVSVWATWCAPCIVELPDLVAIDKAYRGARFETVTVSADEADRHDAALIALRRKNAALTNYRFTGEMPALIATLDAAWTGALPFTLLVAPGGKVVFRGEGTLEVDRLRREIEAWLRAAEH